MGAWTSSPAFADASPVFVGQPAFGTRDAADPPTMSQNPMNDALDPPDGDRTAAEPSLRRHAGSHPYREPPEGEAEPGRTRALRQHRDALEIELGALRPYRERAARIEEELEAVERELDGERPERPVVLPAPPSASRPPSLALFLGSVVGLATVGLLTSLGPSSLAELDRSARRLAIRVVPPQWLSAPTARPVRRLHAAVPPPAASAPAPRPSGPAAMCRPLQVVERAFPPMGGGSRTPEHHVAIDPLRWKRALQRGRLASRLRLSERRTYGSPPWKTLVFGGGEEGSLLACLGLRPGDEIEVPDGVGPGTVEGAALARLGALLRSPSGRSVLRVYRGGAPRRLHVVHFLGPPPRGRARLASARPDGPLDGPTFGR